MPIQCSITQGTGVAATYHVVYGANFLRNNTGSAIINSYLDQPSFAAGDAFLNTTSLDISPVFTSTAPSPPANATVEQVIQNIIETYLLTLPMFTGGTQVS